MRKLNSFYNILIFFSISFAEEIKIGIILGFTGPIESLTPAMAQGAEAAIAEVSASGNF